MATRRQFGLGLWAVAEACSLQRRALAGQRDIGPALSAIEARCGGRLGVGILDTATGAVSGHRGDERFPVCSTHKALSAAAVLHRVDSGEDQLDRRVYFDASDLITYSPETEAHAGKDGMALGAICEAAVTLSDNTAANLMFATVGGPAGVTAFLRAAGDQTTHLDRTEPTLNEGRPGDPRDTTTPFAMAATLQRLVLGSVLQPASRAQLAAWLVAGRTGASRLRAGVPADWQVGEKTGTGDGTANDIGIMWPPGRSPLVLTAFVAASTAPPAVQDAAVAAVARLVVERT